MLKKLKVSISLLLAVLMMVSLFAIGYPEVEPEPPVRYGAWLDEIVGIVVDADLAIPKLKAGALHVFASSITDPGLFADVVAHPELGHETLYGVHRELTFNTAGTPEEPVFRDGRLNPFAVPRIREAMNWLIDRYHIAEEIEGGMAIPRWFPIHPAFPDYARFIAVARRLELYYAHDPARAERVITYEMKALGAELIDGIWHWFNPVTEVLEPVEILILGRVEDARKHIALYVGKLLEDIGFKTTVDNRTAAEASPIWIGGDPYDGLMHIYTGGWISTVISRDQAAIFNTFFTPRGWGIALWQALKPAPEFDDLALRLALRDFESLEERAEMFERALELVMEDSSRIWIINTKGFQPRRADIVLSADLAGGISGAVLWALTMRFEDPVTGEIEVGGTAIVGMPALLVEPWNPIAGTGWIFDTMFIRATQDFGAIPDPFTGLRHPQRFERAEVLVRAGLPVGVTLDWVDLQFAPDPIKVPEDAWVKWDAIAQRHITLAEARAMPDWDPAREVAEVRVRVHFPEDLFEGMWHCGSSLSIADFVRVMIMFQDRANPDSSIHDPAVLPGFRTWMGHFRGVRIVSEDPLIIESFTNHYFLDAELIAAGWTWHPGTPWHTLVAPMLAEANKELAFGTARATYLGVEWTSFTAGPSLPILERHLGAAKAEGYIPWEPTLGQFLPPAEVAARYEALTSWFEEMGHFWIGKGPFYLVATHMIERIVHLRRFPYFPDPAEKWVGFVTPKIAEVEVIGPTVVRAGDEAVFDIVVTFEGEPYPVALIDFVTYLLIDAKGEIVYVGTAVAVRDGLWRVMLPEEKTAALAVGSTRLEIAVASLAVAIPSFDAALFVLLP